MKLNMKRVLLVLCMVTCLFSLSACSKAAEVDVAIAASLKQQTVQFLEDVISIPANQMQIVIDQNREAGAEGVATGLESYVTQLDDLGTYISSGDGDVISVEEGGYSISINAQFTNRPVTFTIVLNEDMVNIQSMSFDPVYTTTEKLVKAGMNMLMGMGTVFLVLIFISLLIGCFKYINTWENRNNKKADVPMAAPVPVPIKGAPAEVVNLVDDLELTAVITAAIAASENTSADGLVVRSIRRTPVSKWKKA